MPAILDALLNLMPMFSVLLLFILYESSLRADIYAEGGWDRQPQFQILHVAPEWDFAAGGANLLVVIRHPQQLPPIYIAFGDREVPLMTKEPC